MSMRNYSVSGYGIILNGLLDTDALDELAESEIVSTQFEFTGDANSLNDDGSENWSDETSFDSEGLYFIEVPKYPRFFKAAYKNMDALVADLKKRYDAVRKASIAWEKENCDAPDGSHVLPKLTAKQIRKHLRAFTGTYYG